MRRLPKSNDDIPEDELILADLVARARGAGVRLACYGPSTVGWPNVTAACAFWALRSGVGPTDPPAGDIIGGHECGEYHTPAARAGRHFVDAMDGLDPRWNEYTGVK